MPSILNTVRDLERLRQIVSVLARHGFGELVNRTGLGSLLPGKASAPEHEPRMGAGERIRLVLEELGPSFIKLGQIISTRPDIIPGEIVEELRKLQDEVAPLPFEQLRVELEEQLGAPVAEVFAQFDETPLASASIGQAYKAKLRSKETLVDVVVKIQRPGIRSIVERDMDLLYWLAHTVERSLPESATYSPVELVREFDRAITAELDFALEADNAERFAANFSDFPGVVFPRVFREASSRTVITTSFLPGKKVFEAVREGANPEVLARKALAIFMKMIFDHGFFHADPHPGNLLILGDPGDPAIALVDLGLVGRLGPELRDQMVDLMTAAARRDHRAMVDAIYAIGTPTRTADRRELEAEIERLSDKYLGKRLGDFEFSGLIRDLASAAARYGLEIPSDFVMVGKALMTVEGIGRQIYPDIDVLKEVEPFFVDMLTNRYTPERIGNDLILLATRLGTAARTLPLYSQEILEDIRKGRLSLEVREPSLSRATDRLGRRVFDGMVVGSLVVSAAVLFATEHRYGGTAMLALAAGGMLLYWVSLFVGGNKTKR
jgi:ubiquinone biosynthesis protein